MTKQEISQRIIELVAESGKGECRSYSGRGMMGRECLGVTGMDPFGLGMLLGQDLELAGEGCVKNPSTDSMGMGTIVYFPNLPWVEMSEQEEDEDELEYDLNGDELEPEIG